MEKWLYALVPPLITFGPLFIALFGHSASPGVRSAAYLGALGLGMGLVLMYRAIRGLQRQIEELKTVLQRRAS
jgi:hypothetical protein